MLCFVCAWLTRWGPSGAAGLLGSSNQADAFARFLGASAAGGSSGRIPPPASDEPPVKCALFLCRPIWHSLERDSG